MVVPNIGIRTPKEVPTICWGGTGSLQRFPSYQVVFACNFLSPLSLMFLKHVSISVCFVMFFSKVKCFFYVAHCLFFLGSRYRHVFPENSWNISHCTCRFFLGGDLSIKQKWLDKIEIFNSGDQWDMKERHKILFFSHQILSTLSPLRASKNRKQSERPKRWGTSVATD